MTRISDLGFQRILLSSFQRAQEGAQARQVFASEAAVGNGIEMLEHGGF